MRVLGYVRPVPGLSVAAQEAGIRAYCQGQSLALAGIVREEVSPVRLARRTAGAKFLTQLQEGSVAGVVVARLDVLFVDATDAHEHLRLWATTGLGLHLSGLPVALSGDRLAGAVLMLDGIVQMRNNRVTDRVRETITGRQKKGKRTGAVPFGYRVGVGGTLVPRPEEQEVIAYIHKQRDAGFSYRQIATALNKAEVASRGKRWHKTTVLRLSQREESGWRPELRAGG